MGLMDKFKNLFTDEEIVEEEVVEPVKIKQIKKEEVKDGESKLPTFMREKIEKEEKKVEVKNNDVKSEDDISDFSIGKKLSRDSVSDSKSVVNTFRNDNFDEQQSKVNNSFKFPIDFEEREFSRESRASRQATRAQSVKEVSKEVKEVPKKVAPKKETKVSELYKEKSKKKEEPKFKATPIISPIYGVLDKNYKKEELEPIKGDNYEMHRPSKNVDFDSVRKKAYGSLSDEIKENLMCENCEYLKKAKACKKEVNEDNLMFEALCEKKDVSESSVKDVTLDEATENYFDYGVEYQKEDLNNDVRIVNNSLDKEKGKSNVVPPVKSSINLLSTLKKSMGDENENVEVGGSKNKDDLELTDDLFNLIDSMYDEGKD